MEIYKEIKGYEELYEISNYGNVKSLISNKVRKQDDIKKNHTTYKRIWLFKNGVKKRFQVHRLVAEAFIENKSNKPQVNHLDNDGTNNSVDNLEWVTHQENVNHSVNQKRFGMNKIHMNKIAKDKMLKSDLEIQRILGTSLIKFIYHKDTKGHTKKKVLISCPMCKKQRIVNAHKVTLANSKGKCRACSQLKS